MKARHTAVSVTLAATALIATAACAPSTPSASSDNDAGAGAEQDLSTPAEKSGTITMLTKFAAPEYAPYFEWVVEEYTKQNPDVTIDLQQVGDQPYKDKIRVQAASGDLPDIYFSWAGDFANKFVRAGMAQDLSSEIGPDTEWGQTLAEAALNAFSHEGKFYGVPINLDAKYLAYSEKAFAEAGIEELPQTLPALIEACGQLEGAGYTPISFGNQYGWPAIHYLTQLNAFNVPPETLETDYNPASGEFTDEGYVAALQQFSEIADACFNSGANGTSHEVAQANLTSGKAAMQYVEIVEFPTLANDDMPKQWADGWSFFRLPPPADPRGNTGALTGAPDGFMVNADSENAALAVDFLKFMTSQEQAQQMTTDIGWLSPVEGSATEENAFPQLIEGLEDIQTADDFAIWLDTVTHADVAAAYLSGVQGLLDGSHTPEDVMSGVQKAAQDAQAQVG